VDVEGVVHRMVGVHLVDEPQLDPIADLEPPVDRVIRRIGFTVDQTPACVGGSGQLVDVDHVVFPLDSARIVSVVVV
jgi:hypothetical protein